MPDRFEHTLRAGFTRHFYLPEAIIYIGAALLLAALALAALVGGAVEIVHDAAGGALIQGGGDVLERVLFVLIPVELFHTVRISVRSQELTIGPFLVVGLIATVRRVLVITVEQAQMATPASPPGAEAGSHLELGLLAALILVFSVSLRWTSSPPQP